MQYYSCGGDKYTEIKMCDLELFSKIRSELDLIEVPPPVVFKIGQYYCNRNIVQV